MDASIGNHMERIVSYYERKFDRAKFTAQFAIRVLGPKPISILNVGSKVKIQHVDTSKLKDYIPKED